MLTEIRNYNCLDTIKPYLMGDEFAGPTIRMSGNNFAEKLQHNKYCQLDHFHMRGGLDRNFHMRGGLDRIKNHGINSGEQVNDNHFNDDVAMVFRDPFTMVEMDVIAQVIK